jgi:hypothetical protein
MKRVAKTGDDSWEKFKIIGKGQIDDRTFKVHIQTRDGDSLRNTLQRSQRRLSAAGVQGAAAGVGNLHSRYASTGNTCGPKAVASVFSEPIFVSVRCHAYGKSCPVPVLRQGSHRDHAGRARKDLEAPAPRHAARSSFLAVSLQQGWDLIDTFFEIV